MNEVGITFAILAAALLLVAMVLGAMGLRRYHLQRALGTFDASISTARGHWMMGVCRYAEGELEFMRLFSVSPVPLRRFLRSSLELQGWRQPAEWEVARIQPGSIVVSLEYNGEDILLAMDYGAYTGLSTWLEAGPAVGVGTWR